MDGFAVRSADTIAATPTNPVALRIVGTLYAGHSSGCLSQGEALRIMTGAPVPEGADAVVPFEQAEMDETGTFLLLRHPVPSGKNVFPAGEDARAGQVVLQRGDLITPFTVGFLAALGITQVRVHRRPKVGIAAIGDELLPAGTNAPSTLELLQSGRVIDANTPTMSAALAALGADVVPFGIVRDDPEQLQSVLAQSQDFDLLVLTGGASVGERDYTRKVLAEMGAEFLFTQLLVKPGKPTAFAKMGHCFVFVLPGSPSAAMAMFMLLVAPTVRALAGAPLTECHYPRISARLMNPVKVSPGRPHYLWGRLAFCAGVPAIWAIGTHSTAALHPQAVANALIAVPADRSFLPVGSKVEAVWFDQQVAQTNQLPVPVIGVVGPHNGGKTTLLEALIPELKQRGWRVAAIKHTPHGFELDHEGKDSWRLSQAGAINVAVAGDGATVFWWRDRELLLPELLALAQEGVQLVLVEGYKDAAIPKIELVPFGQQPTTPSPQRLAVVTSPSPSRPASFAANEIASLADAIEAWVKKWERELARAVGAALPR